MMAGYRANPTKKISGLNVLKLYDYQKSTVLDLTTCEKTSIKMEKSNVLQFLPADGNKISASPSVTEPKIKFYFSVNATLIQASDYKKVGAILDTKIKAIIDDLGLHNGFYC